jgi:PEP-CTERM motif
MWKIRRVSWLALGAGLAFAVAAPALSHPKDRAVGLHVDHGHYRSQSGASGYSSDREAPPTSRPGSVFEGGSEAAPEPGAALLFGLGALTIARRGRRRSR